MSRLLILSLLLSLLLPGCGYRLQGRSDTLPGNVRSIYVEMFRNDSYKPFLENELTNAVVGRFARHNRLEIVEQPSRAESILSGSIVRYSRSSLSYDRDDDIAEYRSNMTVKAVLRRAENGEVLWTGTISWQEDFSASSDKNLQNDREQEAIQVVSQRLADELFSRLIDNF